MHRDAKRVFRLRGCGKILKRAMPKGYVPFGTDLSPLARS